MCKPLYPANQDDGIETNNNVAAAVVVVVVLILTFVVERTALGVFKAFFF